MITRRAFNFGTAACLVGAPAIVGAQRGGRAAKIGYLQAGNDNGAPGIREVAAGLRELGWVDGQNLSITTRYANFDAALLPAFAAELATFKVDLIVASGAATKAAMQATKTIPIVMVSVLDPVGQGLVSSLARPGGNVTGLTWEQSAEIGAKYPEFLKLMMPSLKRLGGIIDPTVKGVAAYQTVIERTASKLGMTSEHIEVFKPADLDSAYAAIAASGAQAVHVYGSPLALTTMKQGVALAAKYRLADSHIFRQAIPVGGLLSYGPNLSAMYHRAAYFIDKILKGAKPADLPVEQPSKYELLINQKTATTLGLTIPPSLLALADEVIR